MTIQLWVILTLLFIVTIPIKQTIHWIYNYIIKINNQLDKQQNNCHSSTIPFINICIKGLQFCKGAYIPYVLSLFDFQNLSLLIFLVLILVFEIWSPLRLFRYNPNWLWVIWGLYTFMNPSLFFLYPIMYIISSLIINSLYIGQLASMGFLFFILSINNNNPYFLLANSFFFICGFLSYINKLQNGFSHQQLDIKTSFTLRNSLH